MRHVPWVLWILLAFVSNASAETCRQQEDRFGWYTPDYVKVQTGGHAGFLTLGTGYLLFGSRLDLGAHYGWVPPALGGKGLHSVGLRAHGRAPGVCLGSRVKVNWSYLYGGAGAMFPVGGDGFFFVRLPGRYQDKPRYYRKTGLRTLFTLGTEFELRQQLKNLTLSHAAFWEVTALDEYLYMWWKGRPSVSFARPWASAFGYRLRF